jgi:hypothetical protein
LHLYLVRRSKIPGIQDLGTTTPIQISFPELKNLELIYPEIDLSKTSVLPNLLGPTNKDEIIIFEKIDLTA